ncbi:MAG: RHS repeat-associated core domain-containing protein [Armatimonadetes bacterium]|nr:RHS repeat-associated core domain-containing protein [Armatimonadota bacterium]
MTKGTGTSGTTYTWDDLNRMTSLVSNGTTSNYAYRADGLRVTKESHSGSTNSDLTQYRYDGQMGIEDVELNSTNGGVSYSITAITRNALGGRGIDAISRTTSSGTTVAYPLYDAHGNNVGMLTKSGSSWSLNDERTYDAWGQVRSGATTGDQKGRYCAGVGHKQDDESGLIYMRARYYEPTSGRFINEDPSKDGLNWYVYAKQNPISNIDHNGKEVVGAIIGGIIGFVFGLINAYCNGTSMILGGLAGLVAGIAGGFFANPAVAGFVSGFLGSLLGDLASKGLNCLTDLGTWGAAVAAGQLVQARLVCRAG